MEKTETFFITLLAIGSILILTVTNSLAASSETPVITLTPDIELHQLADKVWLHISYSDYPDYGRIPANGLIILDEKTAVMVDTPWTDEQTAKLFEGVEQKFQVKIEHVVATHSHDDCMGGLAEAHRRHAKSYALDLTQQLAQQTGKPVPQIIFSETFTLKLNTKSLLLAYYGGGHTRDNIVVWLPEEQILFGGCLVKSKTSKNLGNTQEAELQAWPHTLRKLLDAFPAAKIVVPGHGRYGGLELISHTIQLCGITHE